MNCQSINNKRSSLKESVEYIKPDAIIGCESWQSSDYTNSDIFPCGYQNNVFRKDRNKNGGWVLISVHESLTAIEIDDHNSNCEVLLAEVETQGTPITIGAFHRPPSAKESSLKDLACSIQGIKNQQNKHMVLGGDITLSHINLKMKSIKAGSNQHTQHQQILEMAQEIGLDKMQLNPSRESSILDQYFTTYPSIVKSCCTVPGISVHHMVVVDCDIKPRYRKQKHRKLYIYKNANWINSKTNLRALSMYIIHFPSSAKAKWQDLGEGIFKAMSHDMPTKWSSKRSHLYWQSSKLKKCINKSIN